MIHWHTDSANPDSLTTNTKHDSGCSESVIPDSLLEKRGSVRVGSVMPLSRKVRGYGCCGCYFRSSAAARVWCVYINSKRSKKTAPAAPALADQQSFPTPTTTDHLHQSLQPQQAEAAINFFQHPIIYRPTHPKNPHPHRWSLPLHR